MCTLPKNCINKMREVSICFKILFAAKKSNFKYSKGIKNLIHTLKKGNS